MSVDTKTAQKDTYNELVSEIKNTLNFYLKDLVTDFFTNADTALFDLANEASNNEEQKKYFELLHSMRSEKAILSRGLTDALREFLKPISAAKHKEEEQDDEDLDDGELSLVSQDTMDEMVIISTIAKKTEEKNIDAIMYLSARLEYLAKYTPLIFAKDALIPLHFCEAFQHSIDPLELDGTGKLILYKLFDNEVASKLNKLYDKLNKILIDAGVLPKIKLHAGTTQPKKSAPQLDDFFDDLDEEADDYVGDQMGGGSGGGGTRPRAGGMPGQAAGGGMPGSAPMPGGAGAPGSSAAGIVGEGYTAGGEAYGPASAGDEGYSAGGGEAYGPGSAGSAGADAGNYPPSVGAGGGQAATSTNNGQTQTGIAGQPMQGTDAGGTTGANAAPAAGAPSTDQSASSSTTGSEASLNPHLDQLLKKYGNRRIGGYPIAEASQLIENYIGSTSPAAGATEGNPQFYGHKDVLSALTQMQAQTHAKILEAPTRVERIDAESIKQALLSTIASQQGGTITKQVNQVIEKTIDFIKLIFDAIIEDKSISDAIKALLLSLQIPVIKASMLDQEFFVNDNHPARELLDKIAEIGVGVTEHKDPLYAQLDEIIKDLLKEYDQDLNAFVNALNRVKTIIAKRVAEVEAKEQEAQQAVQKEHARKIVLWELRKTTLQKKLPALVHKLVLKLWPTLMFNHYIKHGKENDAWIFLVTTLREIIDSVQQPRNATEFKNLKDTHGELLDRVESRLRHSKRAMEHLDEVMSDLRKTYEHLLDTDEFDQELAHPELSTMPAMDQPIASADEIEAAAQTADEQTEDEIRFSEHPQADEEPHPDEPRDQREKLQLLPGDVRPGVWFQVHTQETNIRRLKLSVIIMEEALLVFVDHNGERVIEKDAEEFANELKDGRSQVIMHHSVFDHALGNVFSNLRPASSL